MADQLPFGDVGLATNPEPRCPCVLLIDVSGSMGQVVAGAGRSLGYTVERDGRTYNVVSDGVTRIDKVTEGLRAYHADLMADPLAAQRVEVAVVTFGRSVEVAAPFVTAGEFAPPMLAADGDTPLGAAVLRAADLVAERKQRYRQNGLHYYRPWVFLITDGAPTDDWRAAAALVKEGEATKSFAFFAVGVDGADFDVLRDLSVRPPLHLRETNFRDMFVWLSQSQRSVSQSNPGQEDRVKLAPPGWASL